LEVIIRGVRGSIPNPAPDVSFYGGNTACVEVRASSGDIIFFDAGSGIRHAGESLPSGGECHLFISHGHADHTLGLWFFKPIHSPAWTTHIYIPEWLKNLPYDFYDCGFFPVPFDQLKGDVRLHLFGDGETISIPQREGGGVSVETSAANHPGRGARFRLYADGEVFAYSGDHEITGGKAAMKDAARFLRGADIAVVDAMYNRGDYMPGWGHSKWEDWADAAKAAGVRHLVLSHHAPERTDSELDALKRKLAAIKKPGAPDVYVGREGVVFMPNGPAVPVPNSSDWIDVFLRKVSRQSDSSVIIDSILTKAREVTNADAGTVYLAEDGELVFAYTHNDSLFSVDSANKQSYANIRMEITESSIAGYVASAGEPLEIADVRAIPEGVPYSFNDSFDEKTGYRTCSMLTVPFFDNGGCVTGVVQLINSTDPMTKTPRPFMPGMLQNVRILANETAHILERSKLERRGIYGLLHAAAVHDPSETGPHAERVGSISAEIYHSWAALAGHDLESIRNGKSRIRLAAMLHDIGKVGISDLVLKKQGRLTDEEFAVMKDHTRLGASILDGLTGKVAADAAVIARHHHQKWNGKGYAGSTDEGRLSGEDIPLYARIVAIADVFDALVSPRCYKKAWTHEDALALLRGEAGEHFDPYLVEIMLLISDILGPIYDRFPDAEEDA
jgi:HD-GYP domain-containing protein (c-di-GMP phosphodiesterase class II)/phosphoribosyl 1,2-cyclic phosphodiesterase